MRGTQTEMINGFEAERTLDGEIGVDAWRARPRGWFRVTSRRDRVFVKPHGEAATVDQRTIVLAPITDTVAKNIEWFGHGPIVTVGVILVNYATTSRGAAKRAGD